MTPDEACEKVRGISGYMSVEELKFLFENVEQGNSRVVELGTAYGLSAAMMGLAGNQVVSIDNYSEYGNDIDEARKLVGPNVELINASSEDAAKIFEDGEIDVFFLDSNHEYESVRKDIELWLPKVKRGGKFLFHDYESWQGVTQAVGEAVEKGLVSKEEQVSSLLCTRKLA